jgi:hypothetical protein
MEFLLVIFLTLLALKLVDFVRYMANGDGNGMITQVLAWLAGILVVYLAEWADLPGIPPEVWPRILLGLFIGSAAATVHDFFKALAKVWGRTILLPDRKAVTPTV